MDIFLADTNIFLRYLIDDIKSQSDYAQNYFLKAKSGQIRIVLTPAVFFEIFFHLRERYKFDKEVIIEEVGHLLDLPYIEVEEEHILKSSLIYWVHENLDLVDCYLKAKAELLGAKVLTFDKKLARA